jgi:hypothetical protein
MTVTLLVTEKKILTMGTGYASPMLLSLFDCKNRRMFQFGIGNTKPVQGFVYFLFSF